MDKERALEIVKEQLTEKRFIHTIGVAETAVKLAETFAADVQKAEIAAIFHDYAKYRPKQEMMDIIKKENMSIDLLDYDSELWHAPVGAFLVQKEVGIDDEEVLNAIRYHTTGRVNMTLLEKIIFLADYIEPNRAFPGVEEVRQLAETNLHEAILKMIANTIQFLLRKNALIYPDTIKTYNDVLRQVSR